MTCDTTRHSCQPGATGRQRHAVRQRQRLRRRLLLPSDDAHVRAELAVHEGRRLRRRHGLRRAPHLRARPDELHEQHATAPPAATATTARAPRPASARWTRTARTSAPNYTCVNNTCVPGAAGGTCKIDTDCASGMTCVNGTCTEPDEPDRLHRQRRVRPGRPLRQRHLRERLQRQQRPAAPARSARAATASTTRAAAVSARRTPIAAPTRPASTAPATTTARRRRIALRTDVCVAGVCVANTGRTPQCHNNAECGAGLECVNALCRAHCFNSDDCQMCGSGGLTCTMGYCQ